MDQDQWKIPGDCRTDENILLMYHERDHERIHVRSPPRKTTRNSPEPRYWQGMADEPEQTVAAPTEASSLPLPTEVDENPPPSLRRSSRVKKPVGWLKDSLVYASRASDGEDPTTLHEALQERPIEWRDAIVDEFKSHAENGTWVPR
jgi:hypothetical protein